MGAWKISFASEAKERALASVLVGPNLDAEAVPFTLSQSGWRRAVPQSTNGFCSRPSGKSYTTSGSE